MAVSRIGTTGNRDHGPEALTGTTELESAVRDLREFAESDGTGARQGPGPRQSIASQGPAPRQSIASQMPNTQDLNIFGQQPRIGMEPLGPDPDVVEHHEDMLTKIESPEWLEILMAVTRISELQYRIEQEREERAKESYINPYQDIYQLVTSLRFEVVVACGILINSIAIGVRSSIEATPETDLLFSIEEHMFVAFFFFEWCLRMRAFGWVWIFELPNAADSFLVFGTGVLPMWVMAPAGVEVGAVRTVTVLRVLRLARLVRAVRFMPQFRDLWMLIQGAVQSFRPLLWTIIILVVFLYVFAVWATELIGHNELYADDEYAQDRFGDTLKSMFTLFQLFTTDTWASTIARPIMKRNWFMAFFFMIFLCLALFVLLNLISAIIVENAMSVAEDDALQRAKAMEHEKKQELKVLADLFLEIDKDGSGELTSAEFFGALQNKKVRQMLDTLELPLSEMENVWHVLDDGDGLLTIREFTTGLRRMKGEAKAKDILDIVKKLRYTAYHQGEMACQLEVLGDSVCALEKDVARLSHDAGEIVGLFQEMCLRLQVYVERGEAEDELGKVLRAEAKEMADQELAIRQLEAESALPPDYTGGEEEDEDEGPETLM